MSKSTLIIFRILSLSSACAFSEGQAAQREAIVTLVEENDDLTFNGDQHYTQGLRLSYMYSDEQTPGWTRTLASWLPGFGLRSETARFGYVLGQSMYTPDNLGAENLIPDDRPYAGWLYGGLILQREGVATRHNIPVLDTYQFHTGVIGPESMAETFQRWWHDSTGFIVPRGWDHQLTTEPGFVFKHARQWKFATGQDGFAGEFLPYVGGSLGNVATFANLGGTVRFGYNIPNDWGVQTIDSLAVQTGRARDDRDFGAYIFGAVESKVVLHNAFLDGNTFKGSHSIDKNILVGEFKMGAVFAFRHADLGLTYVLRTPEYRGQPHSDSFGSIALNIKF